MTDPSRQAATSPDQYILTIDEAAVRYEHAGHPPEVFIPIAEETGLINALGDQLFRRCQRLA